MEFYISAIVAAIITVFIIIVTVKSRKHYRELYMKRHEDEFTVCGGRGAILSIVLALIPPVFFSALFLYVRVCGGVEIFAPWYYFVLSALFLLAAIMLTVDFMNHSLTVSGDKLTYSGWNGKTNCFTLREIDDVAIAKGRIVIFDRDGKRICIVDKSMLSAYEFFDYLKKRNIVKRDTLDK